LILRSLDLTITYYTTFEDVCDFVVLLLLVANTQLSLYIIIKMAAIDEPMEELFGSEEDDDINKKSSTNDMEELFGSEDGSDGEKHAKEEVKISLIGDKPKKSAAETEESFGSDEEDGDEVAEKTSSITRRLSHESRSEIHDVFGSDVEEDEEEEAQNTFMSSQDVIKSTEHCNICIPKTERLSENPHLILKLPGFVKIQPTPFSQESYNASFERKIYSGATAMMRWRYKLNPSGEIACDAKGNPIRESNSRMVKYSDGTYQLLIGDEAFDCNILPVRDR
jgi:RNA polymerase-associated protein LEO1